MAQRALKRAALQKPTELAAFLEHLEGRKLDTVVEIGTAQGGMFGALCEMAASDALLVSIDLPGGGEGDSIEYKGNDTDLIASYRQPGQRAEFIQGDSHATSTKATLERILAGREADLLFIDGDHSYEGVKQDFDMYSPLVADTGIIALHDIAHHDVVACQVEQFWGHLKRGIYPKLTTCRECIYPGENMSWGNWAGIGIIDMAEQDD